jgi:hypothetical protein
MLKMPFRLKLLMTHRFHGGDKYNALGEQNANINSCT